KYVRHAGFEFFPETPLARGGIRSSRSDTVFTLAVFILVIGIIERDVGSKVGVIFDSDSRAITPGSRSDHYYSVFGPGAVERRRCSTFQAGHRFNIIGVNTYQS